VKLLKERKGAEWVFKSEEQMIASALACFDTRNLLVVLPTGGGKSLIYELALFSKCLRSSNSKYGIVCVPLNAIRRQVLKYFEDGSINAEIYGADVRFLTSNTDIGAKANLLVIHPNNLKDPMFWKTIKKKVPAFVCLDEAHLAVEWSGIVDGYKYFHNFSRFNCPIFMMTATAPPNEVDTLLQAVGIDNCLQIRAPTDRKNLQLNIIVTQNQAIQKELLMKEVQQFISLMCSKLEMLL
jgi:ATP-dependent DNA helicase RecQ